MPKPKYDQRPTAATLTMAAHITSALTAAQFPVFRMDLGEGGSLVITLGESVWQTQGVQVTISNG